MNEKQLISTLIQDSLIYHAKIYGIESLEQKIKEVYQYMPKLKEEMLKEYEKIFIIRRNYR